MFELKRSELLKVEVKLNDDIITTEFNLTKHTREALRLIRELEIIQVNLEQQKDIINNLEKLGEITIRLIKIFFGKNAEKILNFYSDQSDNTNERNVSLQNTEEMLIEVLPFLHSLIPQIEEFNRRKQDEMKKSLKGRKVI